MSWYFHMVLSYLAHFVIMVSLLLHSRNLLNPVTQKIIAELLAHSTTKSNQIQSWGIVSCYGSSQITIFIGIFIILSFIPVFLPFFFLFWLGFYFTYNWYFLCKFIPHLHVHWYYTLVYIFHFNKDNVVSMLFHILLFFSPGVTGFWIQGFHSRHSRVWAFPPVHFALFHLEIGSWELNCNPPDLSLSSS